MRTKLNVSFNDNHKVKSLGAKWDLARKTWYIENVEDISLFLPWIDDRLKQPTKINSLKNTNLHNKFNKKKNKK